MSTRKRPAPRKHLPERAEILAYLASRGKPVSDRSLYQHYSLRKGPRRVEFEQRLQRMARDGQVLIDRRGRYALPERMDMIKGRVIGHPDGYGFLQPEGTGEDLYLPPREMRQVLHGDRVIGRVSRIDRRGRKQGTIVEVLERGNLTIVGRYLLDQGLGFVIPQDTRISQDVFIPPEQRGGAQAGQIVMVALRQQPSRQSQPIGEIVEVLGEHLAPGMEIEIALRKYDLPFEWTDSVVAEVAAIADEIEPHELDGRIDLRDLPLVTIDGEDARDFDDAVYCEPTQTGWRLLVAIADVSHYVRPDSALDREAALRGNSVYFPRRVIPMLPERLSNGLCSLNPLVDRLCFACDMQIGRGGKVHDYAFYPAVMNSSARLTYTQVAAVVVDKNPAARGQLGDLAAHLDRLYTLSVRLRKYRQRVGSMDFELPETKIVFDANRKIERIEPAERNDAHRLIEDCMLVANRCAADLIVERSPLGVFRVHEPPEQGKVEDLRRYLGELGLHLGGGASPSPKDYNQVIEKVLDKPYARMVQTIMLTSMKKALYSTENKGHYALGFPRYSHFTSPIRRYPDLLVHRLIKAVLAAAEDNTAPLDERREHLNQAVVHGSMTERRADDASRDVIQWLKAEFMHERVGEEYWGVITSVTDFGIFVELEPLYVEGLVHITALGNDYFHFDPVKRRLHGERTAIRFQIGDRVHVRVVQVNLDEAKIDFELSEAVKRGRKRRRRK